MGLSCVGWVMRYHSVWGWGVLAAVVPLGVRLGRGDRWGGLGLASGEFDAVRSRRGRVCLFHLEFVY